MPENEIGWHQPRMTPQLEEIILSARDGEHRLQEALSRIGAKQEDKLLRMLIIGAEGAACDPPVEHEHANR